MNKGFSKYTKMSKAEIEAERKILVTEIEKILNSGKYEGELAEKMRKEMGINETDKKQE